MNALAGGGSFATMPTLIALGLPSTVANATSNVAVQPGAVASAWAYRGGLAPLGGVGVRTLSAITFTGGLAGSLLLAWTPARAFDVIVPWLLLAATIAIALGRHASEWLSARFAAGPRSLAAGQALLGIYGGYFGGGVGMMLTAMWGLLTGATPAALAAPRTLRFRAGRRTTLWVRNCVALGLSGGFLEPLESTSIHLIQSGIARLLEMLPTRAFEPADIRRYNRLMATEFDSIRDFIILHFHATGRRDTAYWRRLAEMPIPETLAERIAIYRRTGRVFRETDELFTKTSWLAVMDGQGLVASGYDPLGAALPLAEAQAALDRIGKVTAAAATHMPLHQDFITRHCRAAR